MSQFQTIAGFWIYKEFSTSSIKGHDQSWSVMETLVAVIRIEGVLILSLLFNIKIS